MEIEVALGLILFIFYLGYFFLMWTKSREWGSLLNPGEVDFVPFISVIVPTYNEEKTIDRKLRNLLKQEYPSMEVVVVDDGSNDDTVKKVQSFIDRNSSRYKVQLVVLPRRKGKASALNSVWQHCNGEILVVSDADTLLGEGAIKQIVQNFRCPTIGAATGRLLIIDNEQTSATKLEKSYRKVFDMIRLGESCMDSTPVFNGALVALRSSLFNPLKSDTIADDTEISLRIREKGYRAIFDPRAAVYAFTPRSFRLRTTQKIRRAQGIIQSFNRHKKILFNHAYGKYGLIILPCEFFMHIVSPIMLVLTAMLFLVNLQYASIELTNLLIIFGLGIIISGLISITMSRISRIFASINPMKIFATFLEHQIFLILGLFFLLIRKDNAKWKKIEDQYT